MFAGKRKASASDRLKRRMKTYRERSQEQRGRQKVRDEDFKPETVVAFNLFCLEYAKKIEPDCRQESRSTTAPSSLQWFPLSSPSPCHHLCWLCGEFLSSPASLNQHATDSHFLEWLSAFVEWGSHLSYRFRCPQCHETFPDLTPFYGHVLNLHEEVLLSWLEENGFQGID